MKYCKVCKLRANDTDAVCSRCGGPLSTLGEKTPSESGQSESGPALTLQGQIQQLEQAQKRNVQRVRLLAGLSVGVILALTGIVYQIYSYRVLSYAVLENVDIEQDSSSENLIHISFDVESPGKVAFDRRSGGHRTEKLDVFSDTGPQKLSWAWPSDPQTGIDFRVVYRTGWTKSNVRRKFDVTHKSGRLDVVFLIDTTLSMEPYIKGLKRECIDFAATVRREGYDCWLGLVGFADAELNEPITPYPLTGDIQLFQTQVGDLVVTGGGDLPESSVAALEKTLSDFQFRRGAQVCFVHITDAPTHNRKRLPRIADELRQREIVTYVVSLEDFANLYKPICVNGGKFYDIEEAKFEDILQLVAKSIVSEIKYK